MNGPPRLRVLVVTLDARDAIFVQGVLADHGDDAHVAEGVTDALVRLTREPFDLVFLSLVMPAGDGLALVHHLRALYPDVDVVVMATAHEVEASAHAMALGVLTTVMLPLTGDGILVAADRARERRLLVTERSRLREDEAASRRRSATYARCAAFVSETDAAALSTRVLDACAAEIGCLAAAVFVPRGKRFVRVASSGYAERLPDALEAADVSRLSPSEPVSEPAPGRVRVLLLGDSEAYAVVDLFARDAGGLDDAAREALSLVAALGSAAFGAARKVEAIARSGLKDPDTSAYTFSYFGDAAGREIDRAARHGRRFALLTVTLDDLVLEPGEDPVTLRRATADAILEAVRDSDVLARVEDDEFYLLLPETGLLGALACRRRVHESLLRVRPGSTLDASIGVAVYPADGGDLGRLLRASRRAADRARRGVRRRLGLARLAFWQQIDALLGGEDDSGLERDGTIALHRDLMRAHDDEALARHAAMTGALVPALAGALVRDAVRHGAAGTIYVAGDELLAASVVRALEGEPKTSLRTWLLGRAPAHFDVASAYRLPLEDPRLGGTTLVLCLTELGGYCLAARPIAPQTLLAFHAADLDLVEGLVGALQAAYHLQPEIR